MVMTNNTRSTQVSLVALVLTTLSAACMSDPEAGISLAPDAGPLSSLPDSGGPTGTTPATTFFSFLSGAPERAVDILFVVDNSPSMDPKQAALAQGFPRMIEQLQQLPGGLPDVHIGVVSSNMGAGNGAMGGNCGNGLGDMGLLWGNDPNNLVASVADGSRYATNLIASGCGLNLGARWIEDIQSPTGTGRQRNYDSTNLQLADVFSCLAKAVGVSGCGQEHQLQATRVALIHQPGLNDENDGFLRTHAYLAIVLVTDEDDCSADNRNDFNDNMFDMVGKRDPGDTTSLRCAARGHLCGGQPIPNYDATAMVAGLGGGGYQGPAFSHPFSDCEAKSQKSPPDFAYMPLIDVQEMVDSVNWVKGVMAPSKIFVSGIIGWPPGPNDTNLPATVQTSDQYRIDKDATSLPLSQKTLWDYMPICQDPNQTSADGNIYKAYGGLRLKKFIDAFGDKGRVFSICNSDFTNAITQTGNALLHAMPVSGDLGCVPYALTDAAPNTPGLQPHCEAVDRVPCLTPGQDGCLDDGYKDTPIPECKDGQGNLLDPASPQLDSVSEGSRPCWYFSYDATCANGQKISALRPTGTVAPAGTFLAMTCQTCPASNPGCVLASP